MDKEIADKTFGPSCFDTEHFQVRAIVKPDGLHVYAFRKSEGLVELPLGFMRGSNSLHFKKKES